MEEVELMGIFHKLPKNEFEEILPRTNDTDDDQYENQPNADDDSGENHTQQLEVGNLEIKPRFPRRVEVTEEEPDDAVTAPEIQRPHPNRRARIGTGPTATTEADTDTVEEAADIAPPSPPFKRKTQAPLKSVKRDKVYLSTEISRELHARIRIHSFKTGSSIGMLVEEMITKCYPA